MLFREGLWNFDFWLMGWFVKYMMFNEVIFDGMKKYYILYKMIGWVKDSFSKVYFC